MLSLGPHSVDAAFTGCTRLAAWPGSSWSPHLEAEWTVLALAHETLANVMQREAWKTLCCRVTLFWCGN